MGRFSPTVLPTGGAAIANALNGTADEFLSRRRQRMEDEEAMYGRGLQPVDPNAPQAVAPMPTAGQVNQNIAQNVGMPTSGPELAGALSGPPPQRGGIQQTPQVPAHLVAQALATHVQSGQPLVAPGTPLPSSEPAPIHLMGRDWRMTDQAKAQLQIAMALKHAEIDAKSSEAFKNRREGERLQPGDPGYVENEGAVAGARANAEVPAAGAKAGAIAQATLPYDLTKLDASTRLALKNALAEIDARGGVEAGLQRGSQTFQAGENQKNRTHAETLQASGQAGAFANEVGKEGVRQLGSPVARATRAVTGAPAIPTTGAGGANPLGTKPALTPQQQARAAADPAYAAFLKAKGY